MLSCTTSAVCLLGSPLLSADLQPAGVHTHTQRHRDTEWHGHRNGRGLRSKRGFPSPAAW